MTALLVRRLLQSVPMALGVATLGFVLVHAAPGDAVIALSGEFAHADVQSELRRAYGLDSSLLAQYLVYLGRLARGDLGTSFYFQQPVTEVILERLPATLLLVLPTIGLSVLLGVGLGVALAGTRRPERARKVLAVTVASNAVPVFWLAQILLLVLSVHLGWFPVQGMVDARSATDGLHRLLDLGHHMALPVLAMTLHQMALIVVLTWTNMEEELKQDYVRAATGRGLHRSSVRGHALQNALLPVLSTVGGRLGALFSGAVLTETVFAWPGLGRLAVLGATSRDYPLVLGLFLFMAVAVLLANLLTDLVYGLVDPRVRLS